MKTTTFKPNLYFYHRIPLSIEVFLVALFSRLYTTTLPGQSSPAYLSDHATQAELSTLVQELREGDERIDRKLDAEFGRFMAKDNRAEHPQGLLQRFVSVSKE